MEFSVRLSREKRGVTLPNGSVSVASDDISRIFNVFGHLSAAGVAVNTNTALGVPSVFAAVNFLAGTLAGLPLHVYSKSKDGRKRATSGVAPILHSAVNPGMSSFEWRKYSFEQTLTGGRSFTYIERNASGRITNLWPLEPEKTKVKRTGMVKTYEYQDSNNKKIVYSADEIIDIPFMLQSDGVSHRGPIQTNKDAIGLAIAATNYGSRFFENGGVPPFAITGNFQSASSAQRASDDLKEGIKKAAEDGKQALAFPAGMEVKPLGVEPEKAQLVELKRFTIEEIARIYSIPPTFLQDLTHGTFSNTEQQDLHFVKHTVKRWVEQTEQELNLKIFGRGNNRQYAEFEMDGLLRGDFKTRMEGYASGVQNGILKPNEARAMENRPDDPEGDKLMIQGATVPISQLALPLQEPENEE